MDLQKKQKKFSSTSNIRNVFIVFNLVKRPCNRRNTENTDNLVMLKKYRSTNVTVFERNLACFTTENTQNKTLGINVILRDYRVENSGRY